MNYFNKHKIGILVISRFNSRRLKNKASLRINKTSLTEILIKKLLKVVVRTNLVICSSKTNNNKKFYRSLGNKYKIKVFFGPELNVLKRIILCLEKFNFKYFVRVTGDNPLTDENSIIPMCKTHLNYKCDYTYNESLPRGMRVEIFSLTALKKNYKKVVDLNSTEYLSYFFKRKDLYKIKKKNFKKYFKKQNLLSISIDTKKDFNILKKFYKKKGTFKKKNLIYYLKKVKKLKDEVKTINFVSDKYDVRYITDKNNNRKQLILS